jgi:hypothetical protein
MSLLDSTFRFGTLFSNDGNLFAVFQVKDISSPEPMSYSASGQDVRMSSSLIAMLKTRVKTSHYFELLGLWTLFILRNSKC